MCPEDITGGEYFAGGTFVLEWPTSGPGETTLPCPCGENGFSTSLMASRTCSGAIWDVADSSACELISTSLCLNSTVCFFIKSFS